MAKKQKYLMLLTTLHIPLSTLQKQILELSYLKILINTTTPTAAEPNASNLKTKSGLTQQQKPKRLATHWLATASNKIRGVPNVRFTRRYF